ncbi:MAG: hypothetical protein FWD82_02350 [Defluviitaleaceae bacterium]|nr:hypothetical protein [Defluviitaleaceae bacterium]
MAAFELNDSINNAFPDTDTNAFEGHSVTTQEAHCKRPLKEENIIAHKLYDVCRSQDCLTPCEIGLPRTIHGGIVVPPEKAASVSIDDLVVKNIMIVSKTPSCFKKGYWDIDLKYIFEYNLIFRAVDGTILEEIIANSIYNTKLCLFGSESCDLFVTSDMYPFKDMNYTAPFVQVEAKAIALSAELKFDCCCEGPIEPSKPVIVEVTIGLFSIVKLFRIVDLSVESRGFTIPKECQEIPSVDPCDFFDNLDFPMDIFAPPQKPEFLAGISSNIKAPDRARKDCGCKNEADCGCSKIN